MQGFSMTGIFALNIAFVRMRLSTADLAQNARVRSILAFGYEST